MSITKTTNKNIQAALRLNMTKKSKYAMTGDMIGVEDFAQWSSTMNRAWMTFYDYETSCINAVNFDVVMDKQVVDRAFTSLGNILKLIGEVNGHELAISTRNELLNLCTKCAIKTVRERIGEAAYVESELKCLKAEYKNVHTGMDKDYVKNLEESIEQKSEELRLLDAQTDSAKVKYTRTTFPAFKKALETQLALVIAKQDATPWAELEAEAQARKEERKNKAKARKAAKAKAEAEAEAKTEA